MTKKKINNQGTVGNIFEDIHYNDVTAVVAVMLTADTGITDDGTMICFDKFNFL